nr:putative rep protein [uncultured virus]
MASASTTDIFCLPIHKSDLSSIGIEFVDCYMTLALEHGLAESHTKMEAFITTCLWTSGLPSPQEIVAGSTLATLTQISSQFEQHLTEAGNTSERMGMWYTMTQEERTLGEWLKEAGTMSGQISYLHQLKTNFLKKARSWLRENSSRLFLQSSCSQTGSTDRHGNPIEIHEDSTATFPNSQVSRNGYGGAYKKRRILGEGTLTWFSVIERIRPLLRRGRGPHPCATPAFHLPRRGRSVASARFHNSANGLKTVS